ncbi:MAG: helix-turn-helix domain-containing protein [Bacilli bacterium]
MHKITNNIQEIAKILKYSRFEKQLTLAELADSICCVTYLSKIENGKIKADYVIVNKLFERLNLDIKTVLTVLEVLNKKDTNL